MLVCQKCKHGIEKDWATVWVGQEVGRAFCRLCWRKYGLDGTPERSEFKEKVNKKTKPEPKFAQT